MIYLYMHNGSGNHGCEAIVRATSKLLKRKIVLFSDKAEEDIKYGLNEICEIEDNSITSIKRYSFKWLVSSVETKIAHTYSKRMQYQHATLIKKIDKKDICLSIGGDTYCYPGTELIAGLNSAISRKGAYRILWGCSVEPELLKNPLISKDIASFDLITAREQLSFEALKKINPNTIKVSDPAFILPTDNITVPTIWGENIVGLNLSPVVLNRAYDRTIVEQAFEKLIEYIIKETNMSVVLIPHVVWEMSDDREVLSRFYKKYNATNRVFLVQDTDCCKLKGYISKCRFFIGARTHATIAAYSSCIPTLVIGYSVKARGIARDLFGTEDNYVMPVQNIRSDMALVNGAKWLFDNEDIIKNRLTNVMPEYKDNVYLGVNAIDRLEKKRV